MNALSIIDNNSALHKMESLFDTIARREDNAVFENIKTYPPFNSWFEDKDFILEIAVAGFVKEELIVEFDGKVLTVKGEKNKEETYPKRIWVNRNLAKRAFVHRWGIRGAFILESANLKNGILTIRLRDDSKSVAIQITES